MMVVRWQGKGEFTVEVLFLRDGIAGQILELELVVTFVGSYLVESWVLRVNDRWWLLTFFSYFFGVVR